MTRCSLPTQYSLRRMAILLCSTTMLCSSLPATAQVQSSLSATARNFPESALRGALTVQSTTEAKLNDTTIRMAPGMRLLSPQNSLVMLHTVIGKTYKVNYVREASTGMLLTAWILSDGEAAIKRPGIADMIERNFSAESDAAPLK